MVTTRTAHRLLNADGELILEVADDQVRVGPPDGESTLHSWREVEVELGPVGKKKDLSGRESSCRPLARPPVPAGPNWIGLWARHRGTGRRQRSSRARSVSWWPPTLQRCEVLASNDVGMRTVRQPCTRLGCGAPLRSTLRMFDDVFDAAPAEELNNELSWYADVLGQVRDRDILSAD